MKEPRATAVFRKLLPDRMDIEAINRAGAAIHESFKDIEVENCSIAELAVACMGYVRDLLDDVGEERVTHEVIHEVMFAVLYFLINDLEAEEVHGNGKEQQTRKADDGDQTGSEDV